MRFPSSLQPAPLRLALHAAAAAAATEEDPPLRALGAAMERLLVEPGGVVPGELQLGRQLLVLGERCAELRLLVQAAACLQSADPARARAAQQLAALPWPAQQPICDEETLVPGALRAAVVEAQLGATEALLRALGEPTAAEALTALGLRPQRERIQELLVEVAALWARHIHGVESDRGWQAAAAEILGRFRAYVVVSTGKLGPRGDDPERRERLLAPIAHLA